MEEFRRSSRNATRCEVCWTRRGGSSNLAERDPHSQVVADVALFMFVNGFISIAILTGLARLFQTPFIFSDARSRGVPRVLHAHHATCQPRNALCGNAVAIACGYGALLVTGLQHAGAATDAELSWTRILAVSLALATSSALMILLNVPHPPAAGTAIFVALGVVTKPAYLVVLEAAVALLVVQAIVINRLTGVRYPLWSHVPTPQIGKRAGRVAAHTRGTSVRAHRPCPASPALRARPPHFLHSLGFAAKNLGMTVPKELDGANAEFTPGLVKFLRQVCSALPWAAAERGDTVRTAHNAGKNLEDRSSLNTPLLNLRHFGGRAAHFPTLAVHGRSRLSRPVRRSRRAHVSGDPGVRRWRTPIRTPSLEVANVAGDSAVGRDRIQSAPNLRRVHAQSTQEHRRRIWWLESKDLGQHLLGRDLEPPAVGLDASSSTFFAAGVMRRRSFCATSLSLGFFGTARIRSSGASAPDPRPKVLRAS